MRVTVSSGVYDFSLANSEILVESFSRCKIRASALTRSHLMEARRSLNLELIEWNNRGVDLFQVYPFTLQIATGQAIYTEGTGPTNVPANAVSMLDVWFSQIDALGTGVNNDAIMLPMSRDIYADFSNKNQPGRPTMFWFQKQPQRQMVIYQPPIAAYAYPAYQVAGYYLSTHQTANLGSGETPDVDVLALDALCGKLAIRVAEKYVDDPILFARIEKRGEKAWELYAETNREDAPITIAPRWGSWGRM